MASNWLRRFGIALAVWAAFVTASAVRAGQPGQIPSPAETPTPNQPAPWPSPDEALSAMPIAGYADRLSAQPGDTVKFMVSSQSPRYRANIVRLIHGLPGAPFERPCGGDCRGHRHQDAPRYRRGEGRVAPSEPGQGRGDWHEGLQTLGERAQEEIEHYFCDTVNAGGSGASDTNRLRTFSVIRDTLFV